MKTYIKLTALLLSAVLVLGGCSISQLEDEQSEPEVIKIGVLEPLSGAAEDGGRLELEGIKLANEMFPEVLGRKVQLVIADSESDREKSRRLADRLIKEYGVSAVIGSWGSSLSIASGQSFSSAGIPAIAPSATNPEVTAENDYYFRASFLDSFQGKVLAEMAHEELEAATAVILYEKGSEYSQGLAAFFKKEFTELAGSSSGIIYEAGYESSETDFTSILEKIYKLKTDVIFAPGGFTQSAMLIRQAKRMGIRSQFLGGDTWETHEFLSLGGEAVEGSMLTTSFSSEKPVSWTSRRFIYRYKKKYGREPLSLSALGYDSYRIIIEAIKRAGTAEDGKKLRDEIASTSDFRGATGTISFDENGDALKDVVVMQVSSGKFKYHSTVRSS